jgi:hypothetical protein
MTRFMLPHFVRRDSLDVLGYLRQSDCNFSENWFGAQLEFRFPKIGSIAAEGVELELREALEPWNVLAEETTSGRTVRAVDSSFERLMLNVAIFTRLPGEPRNLVCNCAAHIIVGCRRAIRLDAKSSFGRLVPHALEADSSPGIFALHISRCRRKCLIDGEHFSTPVQSRTPSRTARAIPPPCLPHEGPRQGYSALPHSAA